ncbi:MAG: hypothetical protein AB4372_21895 [Xenococcus sp. (in: cyanobacteria)]
MYDRDIRDIEETILRAIRNTILNARLNIDYESENKLDELSRSAAHKVSNNRDVTYVSNTNENENENDVIINASLRLGNEIVEVSQAPEYWGEINKSVINEALKRICPLWPFC